MLTPSGYTYIHAGPEGENRITIGEVYGEPVHPNCFLVSAAPDLLAALQEFIECGPNAGHNQDLIKQAKAAIAKANGKGER